MSINKKKIDALLYASRDEMNISFRWCSDYHLQIQGRILVNVYPSKMSYYAQGANSKSFYNSLSEVILIAAGKMNISGVPKTTKRRNLKSRKLNLWSSGSRRCYVCQKEIKDISQASIEHIIPISRGGSNRNDNTALSHISCNTKRGNSMIDKK